MKRIFPFILLFIIQGCSAKSDITLVDSILGEWKNSPGGDISVNNDQSSEADEIATPIVTIADQSTTQSIFEDMREISATQSTLELPQTSISVHELKNLRNNHAEIMSERIIATDHRVEN